MYLLAHLHDNEGLKELAGRLRLNREAAGVHAQQMRGQPRVDLAWNETQAKPYHFRTAAGEEVDVVLEAPNRRVVGVEVKGTATLRERDLRGLQALADVAGRRFHSGVLLYFGEATIPFGDRVFAMPISRLWRTAAENRNSDEGR